MSPAYSRIGWLEIKDKGEVEVALAGRSFRIRRALLDDIAEQKLSSHISNLRKALLVFHSPTDDTVGIDNASHIFTTAKHPKSFISLAGADHLLSRSSDAVYVAHVVAAWAERYLDMAADAGATQEIPEGTVVVRETRNGQFQQEIAVGKHRFLADEPVQAGGMDTGPGPYDLLAVGARRLHVDDHSALCRPQTDSAGAYAGPPAARKNLRRRLCRL